MTRPCPVPAGLAALSLLLALPLPGCERNPETDLKAGQPVAEKAVVAAAAANEFRIDVSTVDETIVDEVAEWNTYHGSAALTGVASVHLPERLRRFWVVGTDGAVRTTPVVCRSRIFYADASGTIAAVDLRGRPLWARSFTGRPRPDGTPQPAVFDAPLACFDGLLFAGSAEGVLHALDVDTGEERWQRDIGGPILGTPNWAKGAVYVVAQDVGALHCLDAATGESRWVAAEVGRCDGSPAVAGGAVVFGSCAAALHVFSAGTGELERHIAIDDESQIAGGVALVGSSVFSGSRRGKVLHANAATGATEWVSGDADGEVFTTPAVNDEWVVFGAIDGYLYGLDRKTGTLGWKFDTGGRPKSPVIAGDKVVAAADGTLYLLALEDGRQLWSYAVGDQITAPAVVGPMVIVGSDDGSVVAFRPEDP